MSGIFITATGTDIGKTFIAAGILKLLRSESIDAVPMKPVQTGADLDSGALESSDLRFSLHAAELKPDDIEIKQMSPYLFGPACSPHLAAEKAEVHIDIDVIKKSYEELCSKHEFTVVEGAGGVLVPLNGKETMLDLMLELNLPVLLVASTGLGTINHTLLSIECLRANNVNLAGVIFNTPKFSGIETEFIRKDNPDTIARFGKVDILADIPYCVNTDLKSAATWNNFKQNSSILYKFLKGLLNES
ncbi:MAG: dethiobiotin synthase [Planctomycetota bacterium]|jgi:dethiobiotin synthase